MAASVKDVARHAGLSVGTVSNVLNRPDSVTEATKAKVMAAIDELGYVRNEAARQLRAGMSHCVGVIVLNSSNPFFNDVAAGAEAWAADAKVSVLVGNSGELVEREKAYLDLFEEQRVRGVLLSPSGRSPSGCSACARAASRPCSSTATSPATSARCRWTTAWAAGWPWST